MLNHAKLVDFAAANNVPPYLAAFLPSVFNVGSRKVGMTPEELFHAASTKPQVAEYLIEVCEKAHTALIQHNEGQVTSLEEDR